MNLFLTALFLLLISSTTYCLNSTQLVTHNQKKRTLSDQLHNPGESRPVVVYVDNIGAATTSGLYVSPRPLHISTSPEFKNVFDEDVPKQVAAQQVLYEFEQTPTNAVSNVHVKQLFQPISSSFLEQPEPASIRPAATNQFTATQHPSSSLPSQMVTNAETVVSPVQHSAVVHHDQNFAHIKYHPLYNLQQSPMQMQQYMPGKYLYVNGKIVYQPGQLHSISDHTPRQEQQNLNRNVNNQVSGPQAPVAYYQNSVPQNRLQNPGHYRNNPTLNHAYQQNLQKAQIKYLNRNHNAGLQQKLTPPPPPPPTSYTRFNPPEPHQIQQITKPMPTPETHEEENNEEEEDEENAPVRENDEAEENEDEEAEKKSYQEEDDEEESPFEKFSFHHNDEDEEDHGSYREEEAEEDDEEGDNARGSSKHYNSKTKKNPKKQNSTKTPKYNKSYGFSEGFSTSSDYDLPGKSTKKTKGSSKPKMHYKAYKFSKQFNGKPRVETIEGKPSENIPVTRKHKLFKEKKWFHTKTMDDIE